MSDQRRTIFARASRLIGMPGVALIAVTLLGLSALAASARTWLKPMTAIVEPVIAPAKMVAPGSLASAPVPVADPMQERMDALIIRLRRTGFEPGEVTRPKGRFLLAFDNRTGADEIVLQLKQETGNKLHEVRMPGGTVRWRQALDLHPGRYLLSVVDHPEWVCQLTITAH